MPMYHVLQDSTTLPRMVMDDRSWLPPSHDVVHKGEIGERCSAKSEQSQEKVRGLHISPDLKSVCLIVSKNSLPPPVETSVYRFVYGALAGCPALQDGTRTALSDHLMDQEDRGKRLWRFPLVIPLPACRYHGPDGSDGILFLEEGPNQTISAASLTFFPWLWLRTGPVSRGPFAFPLVWFDRLEIEAHWLRSSRDESPARRGYQFNHKRLS